MSDKNKTVKAYNTHKFVVCRRVSMAKQYACCEFYP